MGTSKLVIVESPAKARTISGYLGPDFEVMASVGHVRDLPQPSELPADMKKGSYAKFAVDVDGSFDPYYVVSPDKKKTVTQLRAALRDADELYLATDEDREGEAIAWHLLQVLKPKVPVKRMVFHEITRAAIDRALENTRDIDLDLVDAQETRRILDRLVGYEVSPLLWRKVRTGLSAGRVQSVATRLVVDRERERMAFIPATYWDIEADFSAPEDASTPFTARLSAIAGKRVATGRDFDDAGQLKTQQVTVLGQEQAQELGAALSAATDFTVTGVESKPYKRRPAPPFTTSTLQQEASRKMRLSSRETMRIAQSLYENGYITYMRTDSTALSSQAVAAARAQARELYGAQSIPASPRVYAKKAKGAQEAHEAIRPAGDSFRTPAELAGRLAGRELKLYELIWKRTIASQMNDATGVTATVKIGAEVEIAAGPTATEFTSSGTVITDPGFMAAYKESRDAQRYDRDGAEAGDNQLPELAVGQRVNCVSVDYEDRSHTTSPPPRYTEASLVKALEERAIGRPSTYAATIGVITDRGYVHRRGQALIPSWLAFSVTRLLEENLTQLVDYDFTASMEEDLDRIAAGEEDRVRWLQEFYHGDGTAPGGGDSQRVGLAPLVASLGDIDAQAVNSLRVADDTVVRVGRYGPYLERSDGTRASIPEDIAPDELSAEKIAHLFTLQADDGRELGTDPATGHVIVAKNGRFGPYVTEVLPETDAAAGEKPKRAAKVKPRTASLFKSMSLETIDLDQALALLQLPREIGKDPESGEVITAQNGRFGPYMTKGKETRSLETEEQIFTIDLDGAVALFAQPKQRGRGSAKPPLAEFGLDPTSGKKVVIKDGRFGPYITDGTTNITVPRTLSVAEVTEQQAFDLLAEKRAKGPAKRGAKKTTTRKTTAKKTTAKKTTAKKTTTKKAAAK